MIIALTVYCHVEYLLGCTTRVGGSANIYTTVCQIHLGYDNIRLCIYNQIIE